MAAVEVENGKPIAAPVSGSNVVPVSRSPTSDGRGARYNGAHSAACGQCTTGIEHQWTPLPPRVCPLRQTRAIVDPGWRTAGWACAIGTAQIYDTVSIRSGSNCASCRRSSVPGLLRVGDTVTGICIRSRAVGRRLSPDRGILRQWAFIVRGRSSRSASVCGYRARSPHRSPQVRSRSSSPRRRVFTTPAVLLSARRLAAWCT